MSSRTDHLSILGTIEVIYGVIHVLGALALAAMSLLGCSICANAETASEGLAAGAAWTALWGGLGLAGALLSAVVVVAGLALRNGRSWAKVATLIFAVLVASEFPVGTAFAVYAFWAVLFDKDRPF